MWISPTFSGLLLVGFRNRNTYYDTTSRPAVFQRQRKGENNEIFSFHDYDVKFPRNCLFKYN